MRTLWESDARSEKPMEETPALARRKSDSLCGGPTESRICIAVAVAAVYEEDADISSRPRIPRHAFNIGNGPRIAVFAGCENADSLSQHSTRFRTTRLQDYMDNVSAMF